MGRTIRRPGPRPPACPPCADDQCVRSRAPGRFVRNEPVGPRPDVSVPGPVWAERPRLRPRYRLLSFLAARLRRAEGLGSDHDHLKRARGRRCLRRAWTGAVRTPCVHRGRGSGPRLGLVGRPSGRESLVLCARPLSAALRRQRRRRRRELRGCAGRLTDPPDPDRAGPRCGPLVLGQHQGPQLQAAAGCGRARPWGALVLGEVLPAMVQRLIVKPNELELESPYIQRSITATRQAYDLHNVTVRPFSAEQRLTRQALEANQPAIGNIRLWDSDPLIDTDRQLQEIRTYYRFTHIDEDRYGLEGAYWQVMLSVRELDPARLHPNAQTWVNRTSCSRTATAS